MLYVKCQSNARGGYLACCYEIAATAIKVKNGELSEQDWDEAALQRMKTNAIAARPNVFRIGYLSLSSRG